MPRLSLWRPNRGNDYNFMDQTMHEQFTVGGTDVNVHKYLGPLSQGATGDATQPLYDTQTEQNIQDLLFLETRDRKYEKDVYTIRTVYNVQDIDFDLTQFGLFLQNDVLYMLFHINDMVEMLGRKIISGDVLELPHLKDFFGLNEDLSGALKRFYVVQEAGRAAEGFSQTWYPHLWRIKASPLVDSQEYKDILDTIQEGTTTPLKDLLSTYQKELEINQAIIDQAEAEVPLSGYDTSTFYVVPTNPDGSPAEPLGTTADSGTITSDQTNLSVDSSAVTPTAGYSLNNRYLTGDGLAPNGFPVTPGIVFPSDPTEGEYVLRLDYMPNRLFRYSGTRWCAIEDAVRTSLTPGDGNTQRDTFINNMNQTTNNEGELISQKQALSQILRPESDN